MVVVSAKVVGVAPAMRCIAAVLWGCCGFFGATFVADCWGAPGLGAKVGDFCCVVFCLVLLLALRCNAATAEVGEIAIFGGRVEVEFGWKIELLQNEGLRFIVWIEGWNARGIFWPRGDEGPYGRC